LLQRGVYRPTRLFWLFLSPIDRSRNFNEVNLKKISEVNDLQYSPIIPRLEWQDWGPTNSNTNINFHAPIWTIDVETNKETGKVIGIGIASDDSHSTYVTDNFNSYSAWLLDKKFIGHNLKFDLDAIRSIGIPVSDEQIYWDTYLGSATEDPTKDTHSLKALCEKELGLKWPTYDQMTERVVMYRTKTGKEKQKKVTFTLEDIQNTYPDEVARYNAMDLIGSYRLALKQMAALKGPREKLFRTVELPIAILTKEMKESGIRVDRAGLEAYREKQEKIVYELQEKLVKETGKEDFNLNSPKAQVLPFLKERGHNVTGTGEENIRPLAKNDPWVADLLTYRGAFKLLNTYILPLLEHSQKDGRIHTNFNQIARMANGKERPIITGRFSSSDPINLQNQPPEMRKYFIPEEGCIYVCADYSQIDLRSLASLSLEPVYVDAFRSGEKVHQAVADKFKVEYKLGKIFSLAMAYNGGAGRLMQEAQKWDYDLDYWMCKKYSEDFIRELSTLTRWKKEQYAKAKRIGGVFTLFGRWIPLPYPTQEAVEENSYCINHWENSVIAFQGQGGTADIVKGGMLRLRRLGLIPNAQVHDELLFEVPTSQVEEIAHKVKYELEHVVTLNVPLVAEVAYGKTWSEAKPS
jgi:DNA polymerase-1